MTSNGNMVVVQNGMNPDQLAIATGSLDME